MKRHSFKRICEVCGEEIAYLSRHIRLSHPEITEQEYYDKYIHESNGKCKTCGAQLKFKSIILGYGQYCNASCQMKDPSSLEKMCNTYFAKTGYYHNFENPEVKKKLKQTQIEKYGGIGFASKELAQKSLDTFNEVHNVKETKIGHSEELHTKCKNTRYERYGEYQSPKQKEKLKESNELFWSNPENKKLFVEKRRSHFDGKYMPAKYYDNEMKKSLETYSYANVISMNNGILLCHCTKCGRDYEIIKNTLRTRLAAGVKLCTYCNPLYSYANYSTSKPENEIIKYLKTFHNEEIVQTERNILPSHKELDIYIPNKKIAIEYDGLYWHSEQFKNENAHIWKTNECEKQGIQLIHIFEDEWQYKQDIVKSRLKGILGYNDRVFARKTECREINYEESEKFLNENHIQGNCISKYRYGLFYNNELVSVMTFGKSRFGNEFELLRFANKLNINVIGGASKLFKHFLLTHPEINEIISYADRRWSKGNLYEKLGFHLEGKTPYSYYYIIDGIRRNRIEFQKHKLIKEGYDSDMSEHEIMLKRKIYRIYDCGNLKYKYIG